MTNNLVRWSTVKEEEVTYEVELNDEHETKRLFTSLTTGRTVEGHFQHEEERSCMNLSQSEMVLSSKASHPTIALGRNNPFEMISESAGIGDSPSLSNLPTNSHHELSPINVQDESENECQRIADEPALSGKDNSLVPEAPPPPDLPPVNVVIPKAQLVQWRAPTPESQEVRAVYF